MSKSVKQFIEEGEKELTELISHYKDSFEAQNSAINRMRRRTNDVLEDELRSFMSSKIRQVIKELELDEISRTIQYCLSVDGHRMNPDIREKLQSLIPRLDTPTK